MGGLCLIETLTKVKYYLNLINPCNYIHEKSEPILFAFHDVIKDSLFLPYPSISRASFI